MKRFFLGGGAVEWRDQSNVNSNPPQTIDKNERLRGIHTRQAQDRHKTGTRTHAHTDLQVLFKLPCVLGSGQCLQR